MDYRIQIKDINALSPAEINQMYTRLSRPGRNMRQELRNRYIEPKTGIHESIMLALIWHNDLFVAWVGTRAFKEKFKGDLIQVQTIECFTDVEVRRRGFAQLGLQSLITAGIINVDAPVAVYNPSVVKIAERCGCKTVVLCIPD